MTVVAWAFLASLAGFALAFMVLPHCATYEVSETHPMRPADWCVVAGLALAGVAGLVCLVALVATVGARIAEVLA